MLTFSRESMPPISLRTVLAHYFFFGGGAFLGLAPPYENSCGRPWYPCLSIYIYVHPWIHMDTRGYSWVHVGTHGYTWVHMCTHVCLYTSMCIHVQPCVAVHLWAFMVTPGILHHCVTILHNFSSFLQYLDQVHNICLHV